MVSVTLKSTDVDKQLICPTLALRSASPLLPVLFFLMCPKLWHAVCMCMYKQGLYKSKAKDLLKSGCNELLRPDILTALYSTVMGSQVNVHRVINHHSSVPCPETSIF